jgi:CRP/FNR family transcriptional regulator, cyclic AMP receptor protein
VARTPVSRDEKRRLLACVPLFAGLAPGELEALVPVTRVRSFRAREEVFHKGDPAGALYVVMRGRLKALTTSQSGDDVVFSIMGPGEVFGEVALLSDHPRTATVRALDDCDVLLLDRRDFLAFLGKSPDVGIKMLEVLSDRLQSVSEFVEDTHFLNLPVRLAKKLRAFARSYGESADGGLRINLKLSQEEWGDLVGATRESINKQMRSWTEQGVVRVDDGCVVILKPQELERLADFAWS